MDEHERWVQPQNGLLPNGLLPNEAAFGMRVLDSERWLKAEERTAELIAFIQPNQPSEERRNAVADYVQRLIMKCFPCQVEVFTFGSVPLKTYLPDGDIDLTAFSKNQGLKDTWALQVRDLLESEEKNENAEFNVKEVQYIQAEVKIIKCLVENIVVDISFNQLGGLCTLCFLEEVDHLINQNHLFKRSIILIKAWCYYESRILGAHHGLISTYALETLVLYIFHVFNNSFAGPLEVLYRFLEFFSKFDWDNFCVSLLGPVPISSLPDVTAESPRKDGGELLLSKLFLDACSSVYAVFPGGQENQRQSLISKHFNVIDPLRVNNNLGRSVSKGNFFRIRSAFAFGAKRLARLLVCPKEDLFFEVNQFFMNTWERYGSGHRPDAPRNDLWNARASNPEPLPGSETLRNNMSSKKIDNLSNLDTQGDGTQGNISVESASRAGDVSTLSHLQNDMSLGNQNNSRISDQGACMDRDQGFKSERLVNDIQGRFLFARTRSSPELTDTYGEAPFQGRQNGVSEIGKGQTSTTRLNSSWRKNQEYETSASHVIKSTDDPSSVGHISSRQNLDAVDSKTASNDFLEESGSGGMADDFASASDTHGMQQEEQDLVHMMASATAHGYNGPVHLPLNLASGHLPLPIPPYILTSMGYTQRNMGGMIPTNIAQGVLPTPLSHYYSGMGLYYNAEDGVEPVNESFGSAEINSGEADNEFWHEQDRGSSAAFDLDDGSFENSDDKQESTSVGYNYLPSSQVGISGSLRVQQKFSKDNQTPVRDDHADEFQYQDSRGSEIYFDEMTSSLPAFHANSLSKTSSESSWEGSSIKLSKSRSRVRKTAPSGAYGKGKSVSEHTSTQADDANRDWSSSSTMGTEKVERNTEPQSAALFLVSRHQLPGFEPAQTSGTDSLTPFAPVLLRPGSCQRAVDNSGVAPFTFYPTGPPVPFFTMLPVYNIPAETQTSEALTRHFGVEAALDSSDSRQNFDSSEGLDQPETSSTLDSMRMATYVVPSEHKCDILHSDFASHWQNLQYGRLCQNPPYPAPLIYPPPVMVPPAYLQGRIPWDGPRRPLSANMNLLTQFMSQVQHFAPVTAPLQSLPNRPTGVYRCYVDEMPRHRSGTGTYLPNPKISVRDRHSTNTRWGNYNYDRNDHVDREGNWNVNSKAWTSGHSHNRSHTEKPNSWLHCMTTDTRAERTWGSHRHDSSTSYQSHNGPIHSNFAQSVSPNGTYKMYSLPATNSSGLSSNGPTLPSVVMLYPYDHNAGYGPPVEQLEFGSLGSVGFSSVNDVSQLGERNQMSGTFDEHRFHVSSIQRSSPDQPSSPHIQR